MSAPKKALALVAIVLAACRSDAPTLAAAKAGDQEFILTVQNQSGYEFESRRMRVRFVQGGDIRVVEGSIELKAYMGRVEYRSVYGHWSDKSFWLRALGYDLHTRRSLDLEIDEYVVNGIAGADRIDTRWELSSDGRRVASGRAQLCRPDTFRC